MFQDRLQLIRAPASPENEVDVNGGVTDSEDVIDTADRITIVTAYDREWADLEAHLHREIIEALGPRLGKAGRADGMLEADLAATIESTINDCIAQVERPLSASERQRLYHDMVADVRGYGPIDQFVHDDTISEIMVNGPDQVFIERNGLLVQSTATFNDNAHVMRIIDRIVAEVGRRVDEASPMVDARLPDGSRVNAIIPPLSLVGPILTIRKFRDDPLQTEDLIRLGTLTHHAAQFLQLCVAGKTNILISGGTGSGKTTLLNVLSSAVPERERIVTIEDAAELQLNQVHLLRLEARNSNVEGQGEVTIRELLRNTLRMRPDRIIVGEVRGGEAVDMLQAMNTGHDGSMTTIHANSPRDALARVETMVLSSDVSLPVKAIREQMSSALHLVVQLNRLIDGTRRITRISEVGGMEGEVVTMQDLFTTESLISDTSSPDGLVGPLAPTGIRATFAEHLQQNGVTLPDHLFESPSPAIATPRPAHTTRFSHQSSQGGTP